MQMRQGQGVGTGRSGRYADEVQDTEGVWQWWEKLLSL